MGSSKSTSGGGGGSKSSTPKKGTGASGPPGRSYSTASNRPMGPMESLARSGTTGLATATPREAETIKEATGKSFNAISKNIGEVGSKYRRPADVEKYAKELKTIEEGKAKGAKTFVGPDGLERVSFVGTGMKDEEGRTILSKTTPTLTAKAPTLKELGGDIMRGVLGYNTLKYTDSSNVPTMVREKGLIEMTPAMSIFNAIRGNKFFTSKDDSQQTSSTINTTDTTEEFAQSEIDRKKKLAGSLDSGLAKGRSLFTTRNRTITSGMA